MLSKHPLELPPGRRLSKEEVADALRLAIIAELDAISLYLQLARSIDDEKVRRVFEDIAREEKTHVGEFLALLKSMDPEQVAELEKGAKEVEELTGLRAPGGQGAGGPAKAELRLEEAVASRVKEAVASARTVARRLPSVTAGRGVEAVPVESVAEGRIVLPLKELSFRFRVSQKAVDYAVATNSLLEVPEGLKAAYTLAQEE
ncbi:MAG: ferritin family protein, partial [Thermogladius sp.]